MQSELQPSSNTTPDTVPEHERLVNRKLFLQIGVLLIITFGAVVTGSTLHDQFSDLIPESELKPSVFNHKPSGTSGALELLKRCGLHGQDWVMPYRLLPSVSGALVIIAPENGLEEFELEQILSWVSKGNKLIYIDDFPFKLSKKVLEKLDIESKEGRHLKDVKIEITSNLTPQLSHVQDLILTADKRLIGLTGASNLVSDKDGALFAEVKHGKGNVVIGTAPTLVANRRLAQQDAWPNFQFFVNILDRTPKGEVWFDERCHGFSRNMNVFMYLARGPVGLTVAQLLLALGVGIVCGAQRFGRTEQLNTKRKISNLEFIHGLANTFSRAKANTASLEIIAQSFRNKLCKALTISPHEPTEQVLETVRESALLSGQLGKDIQAFLKDYETAVSTHNLSDSDFKALIIRCDKIMNQLEKRLTQNSSDSQSGETMTERQN